MTEPNPYGERCPECDRPVLAGDECPECLAEDSTLVHDRCCDQLMRLPYEPYVDGAP